MVKLIILLGMMDMAAVLLKRYPTRFENRCPVLIIKKADNKVKL